MSLSILSRMSSGKLLLLCVLGAFWAIWAVLLPTRLSLPPSVTFADDAGSYTSAAIHIAREGFYSLDGKEPYMDREVGYSLYFLGPLYFLFGEENRFVIFLFQAAMYMASVLFFLRELRRVSSERVVAIAALFFFLFPAVFHMVFAVNREIVTMSFFLIFAASFLSVRRTGNPWMGVVSGLALGAGITTYIIYMFFPLVVLAVAWIDSLKPRQWVPVVLLPLLFVGLWGLRNTLWGDSRIVLSQRSALTWAMRAEATTVLHGMEPLSCLWIDYVTRTYPNDDMRTRCWPMKIVSTRDGVPADGPQMRAMESAAKRKIVAHLPQYLWQSLFEAIEYHLPFVNGWGFWYNAAEAAATALLTIGCLLFGYFAVRYRRWNRAPLVVLLFLLYGVALFSLTNGVPRFRMPALFTYITVASIGYDWLLVRRRRPSRTST
jgi:hypothetical protein